MSNKKKNSLYHLKNELYKSAYSKIFKSEKRKANDNNDSEETEKTEEIEEAKKAKKENEHLNELLKTNPYNKKGIKRKWRELKRYVTKKKKVSQVCHFFLALHFYFYTYKISAVKSDYTGTMDALFSGENVPNEKNDLRNIFFKDLKDNKEKILKDMQDSCKELINSRPKLLNIAVVEEDLITNLGDDVKNKVNKKLRSKKSDEKATGLMWKLLIYFLEPALTDEEKDDLSTWITGTGVHNHEELSTVNDNKCEVISDNKDLSASSTDSTSEKQTSDCYDNSEVANLSDVNENTSYNRVGIESDKRKTIDDSNIESNAKNDVAAIFKKLDEIQISLPLKLEDFKLIKKLTDLLVSVKNTNHDDKIKYVIASYVYIIKSAVEICGKDERHGLNKRINLSPYFLLYCTDYNYSICKDYHPTLDPFRKEERLSINLHLFDKSQKLLLRSQEDILMDEKTSNTKWWIDRYMQQYISFIVYCGFNLERPDNKLKKYFEQLENQDIKEIISDFFLFFYSNYTVDNMQDFDDINNSLIDSNFYSIEKIKKLFSKSKLNVDKATVLKKEIELDDIVLLKGGGGCFEGFKIVRIIDWTGCCNFLNKFCVVNESSIVSKKLLGKKIGDKVDIKIVNIDDYGTKFCYDNTTKTIEEKIFDYKINKYHEVVVQSIVKKSKYIALELIKCYKDYLEKFIIQGKNSNILTEIIIYFFQLGEVEAYPLRIKQYYPLDGILNREHYTISWEMTCVFDITICYSTKKISINETNFDNAWFMTLETMAICDYIVNGKNSVRP